MDAENLKVVLEEQYEDVTPEELQEELPGHQPRFLFFSYCYNHDDGCKPEMSMMYSGSATNLAKELQATKVFDLRDLEEFTEEWLIHKLKFFR